MTITICTHDNEVLDNLAMFVLDLLVWRLDMMEVRVLRMVAHLRSSYFLLGPSNTGTNTGVLPGLWLDTPAGR